MWSLPGEARPSREWLEAYRLGGWWVDNLDDREAGAMGSDITKGTDGTEGPPGRGLRRNSKCKWALKRLEKGT